MNDKPNLDDPKAPFGFDDAGKAHAPYGLKVDGNPRTSNRGAKAGQRGNANTRSRTTPSARATMSNLSDVERKGMLVELAGMAVVTPAASLSRAPWLERRIGRKHTDALAGDAFIVDAFMPSFADGLILLSKTKPKTLAWLDKAEENAPYILLIQTGLGMIKAIADNHFNPNPRVADAGRSLAALKIAEMAEAVNAQAEAVKARTEATMADAAA